MMSYFSKNLSLCLILICLHGCSIKENADVVQSLNKAHIPDADHIWLSHEHLLVDFIGADQIAINTYHHDQVIAQTLPFLNELKAHNVRYFVDATPKYIGRDAKLLEKLAKASGINIMTNTGFYGARSNKFIPQHVLTMSPETIANIWIDEYTNGIDGTSIKPGFIKIGVDSSNQLAPMHKKLVKAAAITHLNTGLTIASHTGAADGLWPQLTILKKMGVSPKAFIWVHAYTEENNATYLKAAQLGCWISLDGLGWEIDKHVEKILFAKRHGILGNILISNDAGWYDPQKTENKQSIIGYTKIFTELKSKLKAKGFTDDEFKQLITVNPAKAFAIKAKAL